jgi:hypothetical protein
MTNECSRHFSDEEASRIWRRAAELQASRRLPLVRDEGEPPAGDDAAPAPRGLSDTEVEAIAREAGIEAEFVRRAMLEESLTRTASGGGADGMMATRRVPAPADVVQAELQRVGGEEPYNLRLRDLRSEADGRELIFDLAGPDAMVGGAFRAGDFGAGRNVAGVRAVLLPAAAAPDETEMLLYGAPNPDLPRSRVRHDIGFGLLGGTLGGSAIGAAGVELLALAGTAVLAPIGVGALAVGALGVGLVRALHRGARRRDESAFARLADDVAGAVRLRALGANPPPARNAAAPSAPTYPPLPPTSAT